jgi:beta-glucosidase
MQKKISFLFLISLICFVKISAQTIPQFGKNTNKEVIAAMTLEEKVQFVVGLGMKIPGMAALDRGPTVGQTMDRVAGAAGSTYGIPRLNIPSVIVADGPAGLRIMPKRSTDSTRTFYCTAFPVATMLASSWDVETVKKVGVAMGSEVRAYGVDMLLGPAMNIHRNAMGGRNFEYYSEDPFLTGNVAAAMVAGIQSNGVGTSIKHFSANNHETNRNMMNVVVSERTMREIYLKGFEIAIKKSNPWTVMSSYNKINGTYTSESHDILTKVLRDDWKFKGFVMTDWFGGTNPEAQVKAGNDLLMPGTPIQYKAIMDAVKAGTLKEKNLDKNIESILNIYLKTPSFKGLAASNSPDLKKNAIIARTAATEGMVLLKNNQNVLPLKKGLKIAALGNTSFDFISGGTGSGDVNEAYTISLEQGLTNAKYNVNSSLKEIYTQYISSEKAKQPKPKAWFIPKDPIAEMPLTDDILTKALTDDMAIITLGRGSGEFADRKVATDFYLSANETALIERTSEAFHKKGKKVIVILNIGGAIDVASWSDKVDGILVAWQAGQEAGNAVADVLSGSVSPSGKLTSTLPIKYEDEPSSKNFPGKILDEKVEMSSIGIPLGQKSEVTYEEGVYVGYRYYTTFNVKPAYEFGYGLSYTNFSYSNAKTSAINFDKKITISVTVKNTGKVAGKEVVQLYLSAPSKTMDKPESELKGFAKTKLLKPNEAQTLTFTINPAELASFDSNTSSWVAEKGTYKVKLGSSCKDIRQTVNFTLKNDLIVEKVSNALTPLVPITEMKK